MVLFWESNFRQLLPEELAPIENLASAHMKHIDRQHVIFVVVAEDVHVVAFGGSNALLLLKLGDGRDHVAVASGAFVFLIAGGLLHAPAERLGQIGLAAFKQELYVTHGLLIRLRRGQVLNAGPETAFDVVLQTRPQVVAGEIDLAGRDKKAAMDEIDNPVGQIAGEIGPVIDAAVFAQSARDVNPRKALTQRELDVGISLVVAQKDVEPGLLLLDQVIFQRQGFFVVGDYDVFDVDCLPQQRTRFSIGLRHALLEVRTDAGAQVLGLADVDDLAFGVFIEVHSGLERQGPDFLEQVHGRKVTEGLLARFFPSSPGCVKILRYCWENAVSKAASERQLVDYNAFIVCRFGDERWQHSCYSISDFIGGITLRRMGL